jgi:hypothetical protein
VDYNDATGIQGPGRIHHVAEQRLAGEAMQDLRHGALHARALAGREDDDLERRHRENLQAD